MTRAILMPVALLLVLALAALQTRLTPTYITDLPPPSGRETFAQVVPQRIGGSERSIENLHIAADVGHGARVRYGDIASIDIVNIRSPAKRAQYISSELQPRLRDYDKARSTGHTLQAQGVAGRFIAWQNEDWIFAIQAADDKAFNEVVEQFAYIRHR